MKLNEAKISRELCKTLRSELQGPVVVIKHADMMTVGVPDTSVTWAGRTTWLEVKWLNPRLIDRGAQRLAIRQLAHAGACWYVLYTTERTLIVHPHFMIYDDPASSPAVRSVDRPLAHDVVVSLIQETHLT